MNIIQAVNLIFRYKNASSGNREKTCAAAVDGVNLNISQGDFVGILGHNGSGKSTLARQLAGLLYPTEGYVYIDGMDSKDQSHITDIRKTAGMVFQNPDNQLIGNVVEEDIAFGPENLGLPVETIEERVEKALDATGMGAYRYHSPGALSGGQKQKIAISGILAMEPKCLILDEPTAMLDPRGRREVCKAIHTLNQEKKITIILITHHMEEVKEADRLYLMKQGKVVAQGTPEEIMQQPGMLEDCGVGLPCGIRWAEILRRKRPDAPDQDQAKEVSEIRCDHISYCYGEPSGRDPGYALKDVSFSLKQGEYVGIIGVTGSGKSTLLQHLNGLLKPGEGSCLFNGENIHDPEMSLKTIRQKAALCFQYPENQLFEETVLKDICFGPANMGCPPEECVEKARKVMDLVGLPRELEDVSPFSLSGGQKRRAAFAGILAMEPEFLLLDEPAAGMDLHGKRNLFTLLEQLNREKNTGIILVSHDLDDVAEHCRRIVVMDRGCIVMDGSTKDIFSRVEELKDLGLDLLCEY